MSVPAGTARVIYYGTGSPGPFPFNFKLYATTHLRVVKTVDGVDTVLAINTDYVVSIAADFNSATILLVDDLEGDGTAENSEQLTLVRNPPISQLTQWPRNDPFPSETHERAADLAVMLIDRLNEQLGRSLLLPESSDASGLTIPDPEALKVLRWNAAGDALENASVTEIPDAFPAFGAPEARKTVVVNKAGDGLELIDRLRNVDGALTTSGSLNAYAVATADVFTSYAQVNRITAKLNFTNTGACTLNVDTLGARAIKKPDGTDPNSGELTNGSIRDFVNDGTNFQVLTIGGTPPDAVRLNTNMVANLGALPVGDGAGGANSRFRELAAGANGTILEADSAVANVGVKWGNGGLIPRDIADITAGDTVVLADRRKLIDIASGTGTLAFTAAATLGAQFSCIIRNKGTGNVTLDPNGAELIDGLSSWVLYPGGAIMVTCTGTAFTSVLLTAMRVQFDASGTFTRPGVGTTFDVEAIGAGGGGARCNNNAGAGGGGGGGRKLRRLVRSQIGATETVTVGTAGAGGASNNVAGANGGSSSFGTLVLAAGGTGGQLGVAGGAAGGAGGGPDTTTSGTTSTPTAGGAITRVYTNSTPATIGANEGKGGADDGSGTIVSAQDGGASGWGGGGGGSGNGTGGTNGARGGGNSQYGGGGGGGVDGTVGTGVGGTAFGNGGNGGAAGVNGAAASNGTAPGGGGGGAEVGTAGNGGAGRVTVWIS